MKPSLKDAKVVAFRERGLTSWELATRTERGGLFRIMFSMRYIRTDDFYQDLYSDVVVLETFSMLEERLNGAAVFSAKDKQSDIPRIWVKRVDGKWGAVNTDWGNIPYPAATYDLKTLEGIVKYDTVIPLVERS